jgi:HrpA-like RNA helicase
MEARRTGRPLREMVRLMSSVSEIEKLCDLLRRSCEDLNVVPLYGALTKTAQQGALAQSEIRKCIVTINIAEASLIIENVVYVIDTGFCNQSVYNPRTRARSLQSNPILKAAAR